MAQAEKKGGLLRKSSASKKPLKEKVVLMYDEIFMVMFLLLCSFYWGTFGFFPKIKLQYSDRVLLTDTSLR